MSDGIGYTVIETADPDLLALINEKLGDSASVLDLGSGLGVLLEGYNCPLILAMELYRPFLEKRHYKKPHIIPIQADARTIKQLFLPGTISSITMIDTLEHFTKQEGLDLLRDAEEIASYRILIFTPRGFFPQNTDHYGLNGDEFQTHRSGWEPEELVALGYQVIVLKGFHDARNIAFVHSFGEDAAPVDAIFAWKTLGGGA